MRRIKNEARPKIKPKLKSIDKWLEGLAWITLVLLWFWTIWNYTNLPETIPTHFGAGGEPDAYGGKKTIFALPIVGSLSFLLLTIMNHFPHLFNYAVKITPENAAAQYANSARMMRFLKFSITLIFLLINILTIRTVTGKAEGLGWWFVLVVLGSIVCPLIYFLNRSYRIKS